MTKAYKTIVVIILIIVNAIIIWHWANPVKSDQPERNRADMSHDKITWSNDMRNGANWYIGDVFPQANAGDSGRYVVVTIVPSVWKDEDGYINFNIDSVILNTRIYYPAKELFGNFVPFANLKQRKKVFQEGLLVHKIIDGYLNMRPIVHYKLYHDEIVDIDFDTLR